MASKPVEMTFIRQLICLGILAVCCDDGVRCAWLQGHLNPALGIGMCERVLQRFLVFVNLGMIMQGKFPLLPCFNKPRLRSSKPRYKTHSMREMSYHVVARWRQSYLGDRIGTTLLGGKKKSESWVQWMGDILTVIS